MKRFLFIMICTLATLTSQAQEFEDAIYIYRNDGPLNAFVYAELDSITLSHYDADSVCHKEIVSQVFHAPDTAFVIPIAAIDSVSFVQPEVKMKKVWKDADLFDYHFKKVYLTGTDGGNTMRFHILSNFDDLPKVGDVIMFEGGEMYYWIPNSGVTVDCKAESIHGKVAKVEKSDNGYTLTTAPVTDLSDIFDQLIGVEVTPGFARGVNESYALPYPTDGNGPKKAKGTFEYDYEFNCSVGLDSIASAGKWKVSAMANMTGKFALKVVYEITSKRKYVGVEVKPTFSVGGTLGAKREAEGSGELIKPDWIRAGVTVPFPSFLPIFRFNTSFYPFLKAEGSMEFNASFKTPDLGFRLCFGYEDGNFPGSFNLCFGESPTPEASARFSINGSLMAGLGAELKLGTVDWLNIFDAVAEFRVGPKLSVDAGINLLDIENTGSTVTSNLYDALSSSKVGVSLTSELDIKGKLGTSGHEYTFASLSHDYYSREWYLIPKLSDLTVKEVMPARYAISYKPTRNVIIGSALGFATCNEDGTIHGANTYDYYCNEEDWEDRHPDKLFHNNNPELPLNEQQFFIPMLPGPYYIAPCINFCGMRLKSGEMVKVNFGGCPDHNHPHMVDLGTGAKWPCCTGNFYMPFQGWGRIGTGKACYEQDPPKTSIAGTEWDQATVSLGAPWQTPTIADVDALMAGTEHITVSDTFPSIILASKEEGNNRYIFLPMNMTFLTSTVHSAAYTVDSTTEMWSYGHDDGPHFEHQGMNFWKNCNCNETKYEKYRLKITQAAGCSYPCVPGR